MERTEHQIRREIKALNREFSNEFDENAMKSIRMRIQALWVELLNFKKSTAKVQEA